MSADPLRELSRSTVLVEATGWNLHFNWWGMRLEALGVYVSEWGFEAAERQLLAEVRAQLASPHLRSDNGVVRRLLRAERGGELEAVLRDAQTMIE